MRQTRKRLIGTVALIGVSALTLAGCGGGDEGGDGDPLKIGIKFDQPGVGLKDGDTYSGFDVDVARYVAAELGHDEDHIQFVETPSAQRETMLQNGQVDMIFASYSITDARKETVSFAGPYFVAGQDLLVGEATTDISGPEDLNGKNLCSVTGSTSAQRIKDDYAEGVNLVEQPSYAECVDVLLSGSVDVVTTDDIILAGLAARPNNAGKVKVVGNPFSTENYGVGLPKDSDQCEAVNDAITKMISEGAWDEAVEANTEGTGYAPNAEVNPPTVEACA